MLTVDPQTPRPLPTSISWITHYVCDSSKSHNICTATDIQILYYALVLTGFVMLVFFTKLSLNGISGQISGRISSFLSNDSYKWFWMGGFHKGIDLMLECLKALFLVLHFSYYTLMTFLMMLSVILLSSLKLLSILSDLWH